MQLDHCSGIIMLVWRCARMHNYEQNQCFYFTDTDLHLMCGRSMMVLIRFKGLGFFLFCFLVGCNLKLSFESRAECDKKKLGNLSPCTQI